MSGGLGMGLSVSVHVDAATVIAPSLLSVDDQPHPVLRLEGERGYVSVFAGRSDLMRLQDAINSAIADLDSAEAQGHESAA
jgi:hypothetical protein